MDTLYHFTPHNWAVGSFLAPGNFGNIIRQIGSPHQLWPREMAYEGFRQSHNPNLPSRLNCLFCFPTFDEAMICRSNIKGYQNSLLFEVHTDEQGFLADMQLIEHFANPAFNPSPYWGGWNPSVNSGGVVFREVLLKNGATVGKRLI